VPFVLRRAGVVVLPVLRRQRARVDQRRLSVSARRENVAGAFEASRPLRGHTFLVIDDVVTTGATMSEAVRAITEAGGRVACAVAFVRVPLERSCTQNATPNKTDG
jgi:predicted amidophosphoribosyltransferase